MEPTGVVEVGPAPPPPVLGPGRLPGGPPDLPGDGGAPHTGRVSTPATPQAETDATPVTPAPPAARGRTARPFVPEHERPPADRVMRRLLRIEGAAEPGAIMGAQRAMTNSILVSAVRCTITYLLVPILTPIVGVLDLVAAPLSIALCAVAFVMSTRSLRRFWRADHAKRWHYTALVAVVWTFLVVAVIRDVGQLL
jgi:hypothetical protein